MISMNFNFVRDIQSFAILNANLIIQFHHHQFTQIFYAKRNIIYRMIHVNFVERVVIVVIHIHAQNVKLVMHSIYFHSNVISVISAHLVYINQMC